MTKARFATPEGVVVEYREVGIEEAGRLLAMNTHNRKVKKTRVEQYAGAMERDEWNFNGDAIRLNGSGVLLDGQHRLLAIVRSGRPQHCLIVSNLPSDRQVTVDQGAKRSVADILRLDGEKDAKGLAAVLRQLWMFETRGVARGA